MTATNDAFNREHGFYIFDGGSDYVLRPEVLESNFYAWRVTGDPKYIANAQSAVESYVKFLVVPGGEGGVSGILDVDNPTITTANRIDGMDSSFFAEVMKYLYVYLHFSYVRHVLMCLQVFDLRRSRAHFGRQIRF